jgi:hypothetical protein
VETRVERDNTHTIGKEINEMDDGSTHTHTMGRAFDLGAVQKA